MEHKRFKSEEARNLMALTLALDPSMTDCLRQLLRMGAYNIRPDRMYVKGQGCKCGCANTAAYDEVPDPGAWNADLDVFGGRNNMGVTMLRGRDGKWFLNGC